MLLSIVFRIIAALLFLIWLVLIALEKGGFVHLLILCCIGVVALEAVSTYRRKVYIDVDDA